MVFIAGGSRREGGDGCIRFLRGQWSVTPSIGHDKTKAIFNIFIKSISSNRRESDDKRTECAPDSPAGLSTVRCFQAQNIIYDGTSRDRAAVFHRRKFIRGNIVEYRLISNNNIPLRCCCCCFFFFLFRTDGVVRRELRTFGRVRRRQKVRT